MEIKPVYGVGYFSNCYLCISEQKNAVLIDAPGPASNIEDVIDSKGLKLDRIILTHGHFDHIHALNRLVRKYGCKVFIDEKDAGMLTDMNECLAGAFGVPFKEFRGAETFKDGDAFEVDGMEFGILETPGHTPGSVCIITPDAIFSGDTLFEGSVGRTDFRGGSEDELMKSVYRLIKSCHGSGGEGLKRRVYPGHGDSTTLLFELRHNIYLEPVREMIRKDQTEKKEDEI